MHLKFALLATALACAAAPVRADTVCEWMDFAQRIETAAAPPPGAPATPDHQRAQTQVALAMFEALNAIDRRYDSYVGMAAGDTGASLRVAAMTAAYKVLLAHYPSQKTSLEESYTLAMDGAKSPADLAGQRIGETAAAMAIAAGGIDPAAVQTPYRPVTTPGTWVATALPVFEPYRTAFKPWFMNRADAVRPAPPPSLTSETYARDFDEVRRLGGRTSKERTTEQTLMARYRITPDMMPSLRLIADQKGRRLVDNARLFALFQMISDDADMAMADAKLHFNFWRPITAIRNAETDGNPATVADPTWVPLINTPNHPEYPCGHCIFAGAWGELMKASGSTNVGGGARVGSRSIPNAAIQVVSDWDEWVRQVNYSRTLGGVHYRFSNEIGEKMGREVTRIALAKAMRPLRSAKR